MLKHISLRAMNALCKTFTLVSFYLQVWANLQSKLNHFLFKSAVESGEVRPSSPVCLMNLVSSMLKSSDCTCVHSSHTSTFHKVEQTLKAWPETLLT